MHSCMGGRYLQKFLNPLMDVEIISGLIWSEIKQLWDVGLKEYISDMWNVVDFITNSLYVATIGLRAVAYFDVNILVLL